KFYEDLGNLLLRIPEAEKAAEVFRRGLDADPAHAILHRFYAKALLQIGDEPNLKKARDQFEIAAQKRILSKEDELQLNHIKVRLGPRRGRLMLDFMRDCKMEVRTIQFAEQETYAS